GLARGIGFYIPSGQLKSHGSGIDGGTPDFICPEQIEGRQVDHRGDLFSVGVLMYFMLTGRVPYESLKDPMQILRANVRETPPPFAHWQIIGVPAALERIVMSCLSKAPAERPESARALIDAYQRALGCRLLDDRAFEASSHRAVSTLNERNRFDPRNVIDQFEASMVEHLAAIKLRGFVDGVGGQVAESDAGVIKVRLPRVYEVEAKKGLWSWLTSATEEHIDWIPLELHMAKKQAGARSLVDITVVRAPADDESIEQAKIRKHFCDAICRELRAYLMVGR
ncbi:MAG: protein kinase, partial [Planctomycetes bacterium]|nr:protein kinase [Planctomycetota bacterium]